jgi:hypothetical protein
MVSQLDQSNFRGPNWVNKGRLAAHCSIEYTINESKEFHFHKRDFDWLIYSLTRIKQLVDYFSAILEVIQLTNSPVRDTIKKTYWCIQHKLPDEYVSHI